MNPLEEYIAKQEAEHPPPPLKPPNDFLVRTLTILAGVAMILCCLLAVTVGKIGMREFLKGRPLQPLPQAENWKHYTVAGLSLESPYVFGARQNSIPDLPPKAQKTVKYFDTYEANDTPEELYVSVATVAYHNLTPDLDAVIRGAMRNAASQVGDKNPQYTVTPAGPNARIARYRGGPKAHVDLITGARGEQLWIVLVIYAHTAYAEMAQRIIQSVEVN